MTIRFDEPCPNKPFTLVAKKSGLSESPRPVGSARRRKCGKCRANVFIAGIERGQRVRLQRDMWKLCDENRALGGKHWRNVLKRFGLSEQDVWPNNVISRKGGENELCDAERGDAEATG